MINKTSGLTRWAGLALGGVILAVSAAALSACSSSPTLAACDSPTLQEAMKTGLAAQAHITVTGFTNTQTVSRSATTAVCTSHATLSDGREVDYTYGLTLNGTETNFLITGATVSGGAAPAADGNAAPAADGNAAPAEGSEDAAPAEGGGEAAPAVGAAPAEGEAAPAH